MSFDYRFWKKQGLTGSDHILLRDTSKAIEEGLGRELDTEDSPLINQRM